MRCNLKLERGRERGSRQKKRRKQNSKEICRVLDNVKRNIDGVNESNCRMKAVTTSAMSYDDETTAKQMTDHRIS